MNQNKLKNAVIIFCAVMLAVNHVQVRGIKRELESLRQEYNNREVNIHNDLENVRTSLYESSNKLETLIREGQSLFSETSIDVKLQDKKMAVTMMAVPKERKSGETLVASIIVGGQVYQQEADDYDRAVLLVDMAESIKPAFVLKSSEGIRQESLDEMYTGELFTRRVETNWSLDSESSGDRNLLYAWISPANESMPLDEDVIERVELIIRDTGTVELSPSDRGSGNRSGSFSSSSSYSVEGGGSVSGRTAGPIIKIPQGDTLPARKLAEGGQSSIGYTADLSEYTNRKDGIRYEVYLTLLTKEGILYVTPDHPIASFSTVEGAQKRNSGDGVMWPDCQY